MRICVILSATAHACVPALSFYQVGPKDHTLVVSLRGRQLSPLSQRFSTSLMLQSFSPVSHVVETPNHTIISLLLHNCNVAAV